MSKDDSRDVPLESDELAQLDKLDPGLIADVTHLSNAKAKDGGGHYNRRNRGTDPSVQVARKLNSSPMMLQLVRNAIDRNASVRELTSIRGQLLDE